MDSTFCFPNLRRTGSMDVTLEEAVQAGEVDGKLILPIQCIRCYPSRSFHSCDFMTSVLDTLNLWCSRAAQNKILLGFFWKPLHLRRQRQLNPLSQRLPLHWRHHKLLPLHLMLILINICINKLNKPQGIHMQVLRCSGSCFPRVSGLSVFSCDSFVCAFVCLNQLPYLSLRRPNSRSSNPTLRGF